ncbi:heterokaryon incompatibility protein-domain-containing protein [Boeremia exigua]|uniref:heterokaryon incompatibility protein-domain-containing protein n=1 Tax=Boeremia exigua TaxID=749465 RepID=UPI001E8DB357|nr:heterokaryon incompatibility protein-domain-containing protein [Boeremia exigua]KAH6644484.1 heterokaryon incompatibility protein-domain-containing protein [Boeremia exigua]
MVDLSPSSYVSDYELNTSTEPNFRLPVESSKARLRCAAGRCRLPVPCRLPKPSRRTAASGFRWDHRRSARGGSERILDGEQTRVDAVTELSLIRSTSNTYSLPSTDAIEDESIGPSNSTDIESESEWDMTSINHSAQDTACSPSADEDLAHTRPKSLVHPRIDMRHDVCRLYHTVFTTRRGVGQTTHVITVDKLRSEAQAGRQCCSLILDAISTWLRYSGFSMASGDWTLSNTAEVRISNYYSRQIGGKRIQKRLLSPKITFLNWNSPGTAAQDHTCLFIFQPHGAIPLASDISSRYPFPYRYLPSGDTSSQQAFSCLKRWIDTCTQSHERCNRIPAQKYVPKRLLEIKTGKVYLREQLAPGTQYACLSHCWGPHGVSSKLTRDSLPAYQQGLEYSQLPKTFRDAVQVCLRLDISHLWIDALCILQDSSEDWAEAAATMGNIYENAFITIAATASLDSNDGLFSDPNSPFRSRKLEHSTLHVAQYRQQDRYTQNGVIRNNFGNWPLLDRAWVYQERSLSTRFVHFTTTQLMWECHSMFKSESGDVDKDWTQDCRDWSHDWTTPSQAPFKFHIKDSVDEWQTIVEDYTLLQLTFFDDRLPALAAVVERIMRVRPDDVYIAGLWRSSLLKDMMWSVLNFRDVPRPLSKAPTWSWASVEGNIRYDTKTMVFLTRIVDIIYKTLGPSQIGSASKAAILLESRFSTHTINSYLPPDSRLEHYLEPKEPCSKATIPSIEWGVDGSMIADYDFATGTRPVKDGDTVYVAWMGWERFQGDYIGEDKFELRGLVLRSVSQNEYERIGLCYRNMYEMQWPVFRRLKGRDNFEWRCVRHLIASLPVRTFKIV